MILTAAQTAGSRDWPDVVLTLGLLFLAFMLLVATVSFFHENKKLKTDVAHQEALRQLVERYEQLAEKTMDAQQRVAADVGELRTRTTSIEALLRSVE